MIIFSAFMIIFRVRDDFLCVRDDFPGIEGGFLRARGVRRGVHGASWTVVAGLPPPLKPEKGSLLILPRLEI
jgi:hypothetical protein